MLGYCSDEVCNRLSMAVITLNEELVARAAALSTEFGDNIAPGFEALVFKAKHDLDDINPLTLIRKNGSRFSAMVSVTSLRDATAAVIGYLLIGTDNSARKEADDKLWQASQYARSLLEASLDPLVTINLSGKITDVNEASIKATGLDREALIGTDFSHYFTDPHEANKGYREAFSNGSVTDYPLTIRHRNGRLIDVLYNASVYRDHKGQVLGLFAAARDITARKRADEALLKAGALQNAIFNSANFSSIATDAKGVIQIFNVGAERMLGYAAIDVINKLTPADISEPQEIVIRARALSHELDTPITPGFDALVFKARRGIEDIYELTYIRKDGSRFPAIVSVTALRDAHNNIIGYLLIGTDNTARKRAEEALLKAGALQRAIFNSANFSSIATDAKGVIQIFNVGAERMLGYTAAEVMDKITPADISDPKEMVLRAAQLSKELETSIAPGFEALVFKASRGIEDIYQLTYIRKDGSRFPAVVSVTALRDAYNVIIGFLLIGTDNTARIQVEEEREQLTATLQDKNAELESSKAIAEKANRAKSEFLSSMSHELRTPLNAILGFAQLLEKGQPTLTHTQEVRIQQIIKAGWYLLSLINEILDLAVIESGRLSLSRESVLLIDVINESKAMVEPQALKREIRLNFLPFSHALHANADHTRLKQVLINLLTNAIKYNRQHGTITVECTEVKAIDKLQDRIRITIKDNGYGLSEANISQLFQPFNRLGQESGSQEGTGIGLVVTKQLVELMGGTIGVKSQVGVGSEFWIELARDLTPNLVNNSNVPAELMPQISAEESKFSLLYVEDNPANLLLVQQIICDLPNVTMLSAREGHQGIALARVKQPDVILMDINLPGISGIEALVILKNDPLTAHIPVLAISANAMPRDIEKGLACGFLRYLTKPIRISEFIEALNFARANSTFTNGNNEPADNDITLSE
ncbi:PAS/PAC sensor hybrid histidine kinase [Shewanella denitrificans OS217]|uniref:histidine kinase n=2 Tax=Shewanella TaxID=22 RepID=Q12MX5_SHEDO|nr:PAS/PAC sensor hybrid histidine kinase [Shewanella denitrificans OS217]